MLDSNISTPLLLSELACYLLTPMTGSEADTSHCSQLSTGQELMYGAAAILPAAAISGAMIKRYRALHGLPGGLMEFGRELIEYGITGRFIIDAIELGREGVRVVEGDLMGGNRRRLCKRSIHASARYGDISALREHLETVDIESLSAHRFTPLLSAAAGNQLEVMKYLIENNADVSARSANGKTALILAARNGNLAMVKYLVEECRVDVNEASNIGPRHTALRAAAMAAWSNGRTGGYQEVITYLISKGARYRSILEHARPAVKKIIRDSRSIVREHREQQEDRMQEAQEALQNDQLRNPMLGDLVGLVGEYVQEDLIVEKPSCMTRVRRKLGF